MKSNHSAGGGGSGGLGGVYIAGGGKRWDVMRWEVTGVTRSLGKGPAESVVVGRGEASGPQSLYRHRLGPLQ